MGYKRKSFEEKGFDEKAYKSYFHKNQEEYIRKKLRSVELYHEGKEFAEIAELLGMHSMVIRKYINDYIKLGFSGLCKAIKRPHKTYLNESQNTAFKEVLLSKRPEEVGMEGNIWTGKLMCAYLEKTYGVIYKKGIYDLLERLGLSHQKAHADYGNAKPEEQIMFLMDLKETLLQADEQTAVVKFDEFSVQSKPSSYYGWAEKNTRPKVKTDEKK